MSFVDSVDSGAVFLHPISGQLWLEVQQVKSSIAFKNELTEMPTSDHMLNALCYWQDRSLPLHSGITESVAGHSHWLLTNLLISGIYGLLPGGQDHSEILSNRIHVTVCPCS